MQAEIQIKFNDIDRIINILKKHFNWKNSINRLRELNDFVITLQISPGGHMGH